LRPDIPGEILVGKEHFGRFRLSGFSLIIYIAAKLKLFEPTIAMKKPVLVGEI